MFTVRNQERKFYYYSWWRIGLEYDSATSRIVFAQKSLRVLTRPAGRLVHIRPFKYRYRLILGRTRRKERVN
jgi:hypothetical protein